MAASVSLPVFLPVIVLTEEIGNTFEYCFSPPAVFQVVLDCPLDACFTYIYQYEPYLKDPVGFPRVMVSLREDMQILSLLYMPLLNDT